MSQWRQTSQLTRAERAWVEGFLADRPWFDFYYRCSLDDLEQGLDNRAYLIDAERGGLVMAIHFENVSIFSTLGELDEDALSAVLAHPLQVELHGEAQHAERLRRLPECRRRLRRSDLLRYYRFELDEDQPLAEDTAARPLRPDDFSEVTAFFAAYYPESVFSAWMLTLPFVGLYDGGKLVAAAGTLTLNARLGACHIGNFLTDPRRRGEGLGARAARALMQLLAEQHGVTTFMLGVFEQNEAAWRLYERLGFEQVGVAHVVYLDAAASQERPCPIRTG